MRFLGCEYLVNATVNQFQEVKTKKGPYEFSSLLSFLSFPFVKSHKNIKASEAPTFSRAIDVEQKMSRVDYVPSASADDPVAEGPLIRSKSDYYFIETFIMLHF